MSYKDLSDEDKIMQAIQFVALGQPMPSVLESWLREAELYDLITKPGEYDVTDVS